jgi:hypothetical protein
MESRLPVHARFHVDFLKNDSTTARVKVETNTDFYSIKKLDNLRKLT